MELKTTSRIFKYLLENFLIILFLLILFIVIVLLLYYFDSALKSLPILTESAIYAFFISVFLSKDSINGQNFFKKRFNLQVTNSYNNKAASSFKSIIRNVFIFFLPIDIILLILKQRRFGDFIARTKVVKSTKIEKNINWFLVSFSFISSFIIFLFIFNTILMHNKQKSFENYLKENAINCKLELSNDCQKDLNRKTFMTGYSNVKVRIFDRSNDPLLNIEVYLEIDNEFNDQTLDSLDSYFSKRFENKKFVGKLKYKFKSTNQKNVVFFHIE